MNNRMKYELSQSVTSLEADGFAGGTAMLLEHTFQEQLARLLEERKRRGQPIGTFEIEVSFVESENE